jgi:hypothetical protein
MPFSLSDVASSDNLKRAFAKHKKHGSKTAQTNECAAADHQPLPFPLHLSHNHTAAVASRRALGRRGVLMQTTRLLPLKRIRAVQSALSSCTHPQERTGWLKRGKTTGSGARNSATALLHGRDEISGMCYWRRTTARRSAFFTTMRCYSRLSGPVVSYVNYCMTLRCDTNPQEQTSSSTVFYLLAS